MRPLWKRLTLLSIAMLLLVGGGWIWLQESSAAVDVRPATGTKQVCNGIRTPVINVNQGPDVQTTSTGSIRVTVGQTFTTSDGRQVTELSVDNTLTTGKAEGIGDISISNDTSRPAPTSSLTANRAGRSFPATQVMRFNPVIVLNGETFKADASADPASLVNTSVMSFPPPAGTVYVLTNTQTLRSSAGNTITVQPGKAFTITSAAP